MSTPADADDARQQRKREAARLRQQKRRSNPANAEAVAAETEAARVRMQERRSDPANAEVVAAETEAARVRMQERRSDPANAEAERLRQQERRSNPGKKRAYTCSVCRCQGHKARRKEGVAQCPVQQLAAALATYGNRPIDTSTSQQQQQQQ